MVEFRIIYAVHFALGTFVAFQILWFPLAPLGLLSNLDATFRDFITSITMSALSILWFFVWYGSLKFAVRGRFPAVSARFFAALVVAAYGGAGAAVALYHDESLSQFTTNRPTLTLSIILMLALALATAIVLPEQIQQWELDQQRELKAQHDRLDQMCRTSNSRQPEEPRKNADS